MLKDAKRQAEIQEIINNFCLLDDDYMTRFFEDSPECTELVLKIILGIDLQVKSVRTQDTITNLRGHSVRLDIHAEDINGTRYDIEIRRSDKGADVRRARYNSSMLDVNALKSGEDYNHLPEVYVIFITERDVFKRGKQLYIFERMFVEERMPFNDGSHIIYVNSSMQDDTALGRLMHDFVCRDPDAMNYDVLAEHSRVLKGHPDKRRQLEMSKTVENLYKQWRHEDDCEKAAKFIELGTISLDKIASILELDLEEVEEIAKNPAAYIKA